jgi:hypothetical protein
MRFSLENCYSGLDPESSFLLCPDYGFPLTSLSENVKHASNSGLSGIAMLLIISKIAILANARMTLSTIHGHAGKPEYRT